MSAAAEHLLDTMHEPWTEDSYLALPENPRVELLDGSLLVSPYAANRHQWVQAELRAVLSAAAPPELRVLPPVNLRLAPNRIVIPDLVVLANFDPSAVVNQAADVRLVVEITSPGNAYVDRGLKPQLYAEAGIPRYLRVELAQRPPAVLVFALRDGHYVETGRFGPGQLTELAHPFPVRFDLADLLGEG